MRQYGCLWEFSGTVVSSTSSKGLKDTTALADPSTLNSTFTGLSAANTLLYEETVPSDGYRRLLGHQQTTFYNDDLSAEAAAGTVGKRALPYQKYALAYTEDLVDDLYNETATTRVDAALLESAGYIDLEIDPRDGTTTTAAHWWVPSGRTELDASAFYHPVKHLDPFRTTATNDNTELTWDSYDLMITQVESPELNGERLTVTAVPDYRVMAPSKVTDPNGTESTAVFDALGRVTKTAIRNTVGGNAFGDGATEHSGEFSYNLTSLPASVHSKVRKEYGGTATWQESYAYSDGGGNVIQTKVQVAGGDAPRWDETTQQVVTETVTDRWVGSGRVIVDNKGNVVKQYEPFFSQTSDFEEEDEVAAWGVSAILTYDPIGRNTRIVLPDDNYRSWHYNPWKVEAFDEEDNRTGGDHENTPSVTHLDAQGRVYKSWAFLTEQAYDVEDPEGLEIDPGIDATQAALAQAFLRTSIELDILGNPLSITDPRGNHDLSNTYQIQYQEFDILGRPAFTGAADEGYNPSDTKDNNTNGKSWVFAAVDGQPVRSWRSGNLKTRQVYDALRRPREMYVDDDAGTESLVTLTIYGDELTDSNDAATVQDHFLKGKPAHVYDTAGRMTFRYDFRGLTLEQTRQLLEDIQTDPDWSRFDPAASPGNNATGLEQQTTLSSIATWLSQAEATETLESETFSTSSTYDARGLVLISTAPNGDETSHTYDAGGQLYAVATDIAADSSTLSVVTAITYNARGQRLKISYGNNTETTYSYDSHRFWLTGLLTRRLTAGLPKLQDLGYSHDAVGNITEITDAAQRTLYFDNAQVSSTRGFSYDALYRLIGAAGREKTALTQTGAWEPSLGAVPDAAAENTALRRYVQSYFYDKAGNITEMKHVSGGTTQWRRGYHYEDTNNQLKATSNVGPSTSDVFGSPNTYSDTYSYNDRGAMVFMPHLNAGTGITTNIERDFRDQIRAIDLDTIGNTASYAYDAAGIRVRKKCFKGSVTEERIYIGGGYEVWRKLDSSDAVTDERQTLHVMDDTRRVCMVETLTVTSDSSQNALVDQPRYRFQYSDHLGTACVETDQNGAVITYEEFHPYGSTAWWAEKSGIEVSRKRYRYTGMEKDEETGLSYHNARYYMTWLGRWERPDPIGLGDGLNRFAYVSGNPVGGRDPSGMEGGDDETASPQDAIKGLKINTTGVGFVVKNRDQLNQTELSKIKPNLDAVTLPPHLNISFNATPEVFRENPDGSVIYKVTIDWVVDIEGPIKTFFKADPGAPQKYGVGETVEEHERAHAANLSQLYTDENIVKLLSGELSYEDGVTGEVINFSGVRLPTTFFFKAYPQESITGDQPTPPIEDLRAVLGPDLNNFTAQLSRYISRSLNYIDNAQTHAPVPGQSSFNADNPDEFPHRPEPTATSGYALRRDEGILPSAPKLNTGVYMARKNPYVRPE